MYNSKSRQAGKALIVSPYLDHLGGGERYMLTLASVLETLDYQIFFAWDNLEDITHLSDMLGIKLQNPHLARSINKLYFSHNPLNMYSSTKGYDVVVYLSDGSLPLLGGKKNLIHMQVPFHDVGGKSWKNQLKKHFLHAVIVNSHFTKKIVDEEYGINSRVLYPPVSTISSGEKTKTILSVGRFEPSLNAKKQDVLIRAFRELSPRLPDWKLVLAGASSSDEWTLHLQKLAEGLPVTFLINCSHKVLSSSYQKASIYWHAAGYEIDESKNPELTEHFGITTVEAIGAGCIPLVVPKGGQKEIVTIKDLYWDTLNELTALTGKVVSNLEHYQSLASKLNISPFNTTSFSSNLKKLLC